MRRAILVVTAALVAAAWVVPGSARGQDADPAFSSAVFLLQSSMKLKRDGSHNVMLRALRHLRDPALAPLFSEMVQSDQDTLKIHGILGLAECSPDRKLDLVRIAAMKDPSLQARVIGAAIDGDTLDDGQARQLLGWPGLDNAVKVLVVGQLIHEKPPVGRDLLIEATQADNIRRRMLAHLLLAQQGEQASMQQLAALSTSTDGNRDQVRLMLLATMIKYEMDHVAPWAMQIVSEPQTPWSVKMLALRAAMRFKVAGASQAWRQALESETEPAQRTRFALLGLALCEHLEPGLFEPPVGVDDPLIVKILAAGRAVAEKRDIPAATLPLIKMHHAMSSQWVLEYCRATASDADAAAMLPALIDTYGDPPRQNMTQRVDDVVMATQILCERNLDMAIQILRPRLLDPTTEATVQQGILLGLIRAKGTGMDKIVEGFTGGNADTKGLALVLVAKQGQKLTPAQLQELGLLVRGGGSFPPALRLQAAWAYLKGTNQTATALAQVIGQDTAAAAQ